MKKSSRIQVLLSVGFSALCAIGLSARVANKTYIAPRNELQQVGRLWALSCPLKKLRAGEHGLTADVSVFTSKSTSSVGLGRALGTALKSDFSDASGSVVVAPSADSTATNALFDRAVDHTYSLAGDALSMSGVLALRPVQKRFGVILGLDADLGEVLPLDGWHLALTMPIVKVTNSLGATYTDSVASVAGTNKVVTPNSTLPKNFAGLYTQGGNNSQQSLQYAKVLTDEHSRGGVADMKIALHYDITREIDGLVQVRGGAIVPFGVKPTAERLFEAVYGNGGHAGAFFGCRADMRVWRHKEKRMALWLSSDVEYTFLFGSHELRTAGLFNNNASVQLTSPWGHTVLGVQNGVSGTFPLANVLTREMNVVPGSHVEINLGLSFAWNDFYGNLGYNMFYKKAETVDMAEQWPNDRYGVASFGYTAASPAANFTDSVFTGSHDAVGPVNELNDSVSHLNNGGASVLYQVDMSVCTCAQQQTQQALAGFGYHGSVRGVPVDVSAMAAYEFALDTSTAINGWSVGAKLTMYL